MKVRFVLIPYIRKLYEIIWLSNGGSIMKIKHILLVGAACILSISFLLCGKKEEVREIIRPVRYQQVFATGGTRVRTFSGAIQAGHESRLSFKVPGTVQRKAVDV